MLLTAKGKIDEFLILDKIYQLLKIWQFCIIVKADYSSKLNGNLAMNNRT